MRYNDTSEWSYRSPLELKSNFGKIRRYVSDFECETHFACSIVY